MSLWVALLLATAGVADDTPRGAALRIDMIPTVVSAGVASTVWLTSELIVKEELVPPKCRWCDRDADGTDALNAIDAWGTGAHWEPSDQDFANDASDVLGFGVVPAAAFGTHFLIARGDGFDRYAEDVAIFAQTISAIALLNQIVKFSVGRERPFVHALPSSVKSGTAHPEDNNLSFYSGHSSMVFSIVSTVGTVSELRGYEHRRWIWIVGMPLAGTVAYLRMGAARHYLTDVLVGSAVGTALGAALPLLLHPREGSPIHISANGRGAQLTMAF